MSNLAEADPAAPRTPRLMRDRSGSQRVTNIELFFDLVYVYAVTQRGRGGRGHRPVALAVASRRPGPVLS